MIVVVNDRMQKGYVYELTEPMGRNFHPEFRPGRRLTRDEIVRFLNEAAGQSVLPLLQRWKGFESA